MDTPDTPPAEGYVTFVEYAARHGATYHQVYGWVRWGHLAGARRDGAWYVRWDAPRPSVRRGGFDQARRLVVARAAITPEARREAARKRAAHSDPDRRREIGR